MCNALGYAALEAALDPILQLTPTAIAAHLQRYHDRLEPGLLNRGFTSARAADPAARSGILSLRPPPGVSLQGLARGLGARGVDVATPDGWLRFGPHWPNALDEVEGVLRAVDEALLDA